LTGRSCLARARASTSLRISIQTVESVGYNLDGHPTVFVGRVVLDDLQAAQLRKAGWRVRRLPGARR